MVETPVGEGRPSREGLHAAGPVHPWDHGTVAGWGHCCRHLEADSTLVMARTQRLHEKTAERSRNNDAEADLAADFLLEQAR